MDAVFLAASVLAVGLIVLLAIGVPIGIAFAVLGVAFIWFYRGTTGVGIVGDIVWETTTSETFITVPLFVLMGEILFVSGIGSDIFDVTAKWLGRLPGGLAAASMVSSCLFGSVCGSSIATTATIGTVAYPEMRKHGYAEELCAGILTTGGGVGILIPPSIPLIIYAIIAEESVGKMFMAGVVPGLMLTILPATYVLIYAYLRPSKAPRASRVTWKDSFISLLNLWPLVILVVSVLGSLYTGLVTPSEAGGMGCLAAFLIVFTYKRTPLSLVWKGVVKAISTTAFIIMVLIGAHILNHAIAWSKIPMAVMELLVYSEAVPAWGVIPLVCAAFFIMGMFMDSLAIMLLVMPTLMPAAILLGLDPIWLGVIMVLNIEVALLTPPVGLNMFVIQDISGLSTSKVARGVLPFVAVDLVTLILCVAFPILSLWLPSTMG
ncbi:TRAP transporter large permease [Chloroflexota bacterium]